MPIITSIGHVGIKTPVAHFKLIPSLARIATLTAPTEIYTSLIHPDTDRESRLNAAYSVILACTNDDRIKPFLGRQMIGKPRMRNGIVTKTYSDVFVSDVHAVAIAESLLFHGMIGEVKVRPQADTESSYTNVFDPLEWVAALVAHLGISEKSAWSMTMTSALSALKAKFPPSEKQKMIDNIDKDKAAHDEWYRSIYGPNSI